MELRTAVSRYASAALSLLVIACALPQSAAAQLKVAVYGIHMDPSSQDARDFSRASYGGGIRAVVPIPQVANLFAGSVGLELVNFLNETHTFTDRMTGLRVEQQTNQDYIRFFLGPEFGSHGSGFLRPYAGANVALIYYGISTDVVVPDDYNRENEIRQNLASRHEAAFGYDVSVGTDLNFGRFLAEGGVRLVKSFNVPQQLGDGAVTIHPAYIQIYLGVGVNVRKRDFEQP